MTYQNNSGNSQPITVLPNNIIYVNNVPSSGQGWTTYTISSGVFPNLQTPVPAAGKWEEKKENLGCSCKKCKEFNEMAEPNQDDGTFICWSCRHGY